MTDPNDLIDKATETAKQVVHDARGVAQDVLATAGVAAHKLLEQANTEPTNADLKVIMEEGANTFKEHARSDNESFTAIKTRLDELPTKDQIKRMNDFLEKLDTGERIFSFGFNNSGKIVGFMILLGAIYMIFKVGAAAAFAWFTGKSL